MFDVPSGWLREDALSGKSILLVSCKRGGPLCVLVIGWIDRQRRDHHRGAKKVVDQGCKRPEGRCETRGLNCLNVHFDQYSSGAQMGVCASPHALLTSCSSPFSAPCHVLLHTVWKSVIGPEAVGSSDTMPIWRHKKWATEAVTKTYRASYN